MDYYSKFENCALSMIDSVKRILYSKHEDIFDRLDFEDDYLFLEPLIYTYIHQNDTQWLDGIIYGFEASPKEVFNVFSNSDGVIYLPQIGYFHTKFKNATFQISCNNGKYMLSHENQRVAHEFESLSFLSGNIEIIKHLHPLLERFFFENDNAVSVDLKITNEYKSHVDNFEKGLKILQIANPSHYSLLQVCLKKVLFFSSTYPNSFAVLAAHNMLFLNVSSWDTEMFFVDHLSHEGAHVTFNTLTYDSKLNLFKYPPNTAFADVSGIPTEHSNLYLRFHGLFTFVEITKSLTYCMSMPELSSQSRHETKGRLGFQIRRFKNSLKSFEKLDIFQKTGLEWYTYFISVLEKLEEVNGYLTDQYDYSDQSYDFNSDVFFKLNPLADRDRLI